jgi:hypothetical protein
MRPSPRICSEPAILDRTSLAQPGASTKRTECRWCVLLACDEEGADGTQLAHCLKVYLPPPDGKFGMVFRVERRDGKLRLVYAAFGVRHHPRDSNAPTVYQIAHDRLQA